MKKSILNRLTEAANEALYDPPGGERKWASFAITEGPATIADFLGDKLEEYRDRLEATRLALALGTPGNAATTAVDAIAKIVVVEIVMESQSGGFSEAEALTRALKRHNELLIEIFRLDSSSSDYKVGRKGAWLAEAIYEAHNVVLKYVRHGGRGLKHATRLPS